MGSEMCIRDSDVLDAADLEDHKLVDGIPHISFPFGLDIRQFLANGTIVKKILLSSMIVAGDAVTQGIFPTLQMLLHSIPFFKIRPGIKLILFFEQLVTPPIVTLCSFQLSQLMLQLP